MVFLLDGFDEYGEKSNFGDEIFNLKRNKNIRVIITSRSYY
jgi:hypothetical protein